MLLGLATGHTMAPGKRDRGVELKDCYRHEKGISSSNREDLYYFTPCLGSKSARLILSSKKST